MRKFLISAALLSATAVSVATPAAAQYRGPAYSQYRGGGVERELVQIREQIRLGFQRGFLTRNEAAKLSRDADRIDERLRRKSWNGLSFRERADLQRRVQNLRERLRFERFDNQRRRRW